MLSDEMRGKCRDFTHFTIYAKSDQGIYDAFNQALAEVRTDYVLYIGTNDIINLEELDRLQNSLKHQADIYVYGVLLNNRVSNIEKFGDILFYHHQGTWLCEPLCMFLAEVSRATTYMRIWRY